MKKIQSSKQNAKRKVGVFLFALFAFSSTHFLRAAESPVFELTLQPESRLWLTGDSTLHPYASTATKMNFLSALEIPKGTVAQSLTEKLVQAELRAFKLTIPVESLKSGEKGLDKNMYKTLKAETYAFIEFKMTDKHLLPAAGANKMSAGGMLMISGKENPVQIDAEVEILPKGIRVFGKKKLLMSDYGIKPPTILGFIKVRDEVTIHFDLVLSPL